MNENAREISHRASSEECLIAEKTCKAYVHSIFADAKRAHRELHSMIDILFFCRKKVATANTSRPVHFAGAGFANE